MRRPASGYRNRTTGAFTGVGNQGFSWASTVSGTGANYMDFGYNYVNPINANNRAYGFQVRCLRAFTKHPLLFLRNTHMIKYLKIALLGLWGGVFGVGLGACNRPDLIPEQTLRAIIRDELISQSVAMYSTEESLKPLDSLDLHSEVLARYGYQMEDFQHTLRVLSLRKSNPMGAILAGVAEDIKIESKAAQARYSTKLRVDTLAMDYTADTVWRKDTVISGKWGEYTFTYAARGIFYDSLVPMGTYRLVMHYATGGHAAPYTKSVRYRKVLLAKKLSTSDGSLWMVPSRDTVRYEHDVPVVERVKSLSFTFRDTWNPRLRGVSSEPDTCYIAGLRLVRILPVDQAREQYYYRTTGLWPLEDVYYERYIDSMLRRHQAFGGPLFARPAGQVAGQ